MGVSVKSKTPPTPTQNVTPPSLPQLLLCLHSYSLTTLPFSKQSTARFRSAAFFVASIKRLVLCEPLRPCARRLSQSRQTPSSPLRFHHALLNTLFLARRSSSIPWNASRCSLLPSPLSCRVIGQFEAPLVHLIWPLFPCEASRNLPWNARQPPVPSRRLQRQLSAAIPLVLSWIALTSLVLAPSPAAHVCCGSALPKPTIRPPRGIRRSHLHLIPQIHPSTSHSVETSQEPLSQYHARHSCSLYLSQHPLA